MRLSVIVSVSVLRIASESLFPVVLFITCLKFHLEILWTELLPFKVICLKIRKKVQNNLHSFEQRSKYYAFFYISFSKIILT